MQSILFPNSLLLRVNSPEFLFIPTLLDTSNSSRSLVASSIAMARSLKYPVQKWRQSRALSWDFLRSDVRRNSLSSYKTGKMMIHPHTKVIIKHFTLRMISDTIRISIGINLDKDSMKSVYEKFGLEAGTQDFIGHAMALYLDDE